MRISFNSLDALIRNLTELRSQIFKKTARQKHLFIVMFIGVSSITFPYIFGLIKLPRIEEFSYSLIPLEIAEQQKNSSSDISWYEDYGIGVPWPIPHTMNKSPFSTLFGEGHPFQSMGQFMAIHITIQIISLWLIGREFRFRDSINLVFVVSITFASQLEYLVTSDAAAVYLGWLILPTIYLSIFKISNSANNLGTLQWTIFLGIFVSYGISNTHPGVFSTYLISCAILFFSLNIRSLKKLAFGLFGLVLSLALSAEKIYSYLSQWILFPEWVDRSQYNYESGIGHTFWSLFLKPLTTSVFSNKNRDSVFTTWISENQYTRVLNFGSPIAALLLIYILYHFLKEWASNPTVKKVDNSASLSRNKAIVINFILNSVIMLLPAKFLTSAVSASWTFRDPATLYGMLILGVYFNSALKKPIKPTLKKLLVLVHFFSIAISSLFIVFGPTFLNDPDFWSSKKYDNLVSNAKIEQNSKAIELIDDALDCEIVDCEKFGKRVAMSGQVSNLVARGELKEYGLILNSLPLHGFQEINAVTKGISQDRVHTSQLKFYGMLTDNTYQSFSHVSGEYNWLLQNPQVRDFMGVRVLIFSATEKVNLRGLEFIGQIAASQGKDAILFYRNVNANPRVIQLTRNPVTSNKSQCDENRQSFTCLEFANEGKRSGKDPSLTYDLDIKSMKIDLEILSTRSSVLVNSAWSKSWKSNVGKIQNYHGLILIEIPANASRIELTYSDKNLEFIKSMEKFVLLTSLIGLLILFFKRRTKV
jgi:hypothetical protein